MRNYQYDVFISYASEDKGFATKLADSLRDNGVKVWFDDWRIPPGDNVQKKINEGIKLSRKMAVVFSPIYLTKDFAQAESFASLHSDSLSRERSLIPLLKEECELLPLFDALSRIDFTKEVDFHFNLRKLIEALDLPTQKRENFKVESDQFSDSITRRLFQNEKKSTSDRYFLNEALAYYEAKGFQLEAIFSDVGFQCIEIERTEPGFEFKGMVICQEDWVTLKDVERFLEKKAEILARNARSQWTLLYRQGCDENALERLRENDINSIHYANLLQTLAPLEKYSERLKFNFEKFMVDQWSGKDCYVRPKIKLEGGSENVPALEHFSKWLGNSEGKLLTLLGDLGTGKTTLTRFLSYHMAKSFLEDPVRHPAPIHIPLKVIKKAITLKSVVDAHFESQGFKKFDFEGFNLLAKLGKVVVFFDAFDEMADRVRWEVSCSNFSELSQAAFNGWKSVLTCRSHYFKNSDEEALLTGKSSILAETETVLYERLRKISGANAVYLQKFDEKEILDYLEKAGTGSCQEDWQTIKGIYNLEQLSTQPLLLEMIAKLLRENSLKEKNLNAAGLYKIFTDIWVQREKENERMLEKDVRLELMLHLALKFWTEETDSIHYKETISFINELLSEKKIRVGPEKPDDVAGDMQAASFLNRDDEGNFSFIHKSFSEYFLARKIFRDIQESEYPKNPLKVLDLPILNPKVIFFLSQIDANDELTGLLQKRLQDGYLSNVSENALQVLYWTVRHRLGMEREIDRPDELLNELKNTLPKEMQLQNAQLQGLNFRYAYFDKADFSDAKFQEADLIGSVFEDCNLEGVDLDSAKTQESRGLAGFTSREAGTIDNAINLAPIVQRGHANGVESVVFSPDGAYIVTGGRDGVIRVWRKDDGVLLRELEGHSGWVYSVAFHDGQIASGSDDKTVRVWEAESGRCLKTLEGHSGWVYSVAFHDGQIASGSYDKTVRVWEAESGRCLKTLEGHSGGVSSVAFHDGQIASGSYDNTVRVWEAESGRCLKTLEGHSGGVYSVAFHDGQIASGSYDKTVRVWEAESGRCLKTLEGHLGSARSVSFIPNSDILIVGGYAGRIQIWDLKSYQTIASFYSFDANGWLVLLPDGRFDANAEGLRHLRYTEEVGFKSYKADELVEHFYKPDEIKEVLAKHFPKKT